ncbi:MAG: ATP-binding protein [candidate division KSB1 bacterium]|jgi:hypothetical protein|nr:ATP-binding protein [candidate division KSB1 bacterium]
MNIDISDILYRYQNDARRQAVAIHSSVVDHFQNIFSDYQEKTGKIRKAGQQNDIPDLEKSVEELIAWTDEILPVKMIECCKEWEQTFDMLTADLPGSIHVKYAEDYFDSNNDDGFRVRIWKLLKRKECGLTRRLHHLKQSIYKLFGKSVQSLQTPGRKVALTSFLTYHYQIPVSQLLFETYNVQLNNVAKRFAEFGKLFEACLTFKSAQLDTSSTIFDNVNIEADIGVNSLPDQDFEDALSEIYDRALSLFAHSGSFVLSNRKYSSRKIACKHRELSDKIKSAATRWEDFFEGQKEDLQKDLELILLEVRISKILYETINPLRKRVHTVVLDYFDEPGKMIANARETILAEEVNDEETLKNLVAQENRLTFRKFRRQILPELMDRIAQVQIEKSLENYLSRIKFATDALSDEHIIFNELDLRPTLPEFKTSRVEFKDIVQEEYLEDLEVSFDAFYQNNKQSIDEILRQISELDYIIDYNLVSALNIFEDRTEENVLISAKSVIVQGFDLVQKQIEDLVKKTEALSNVIEENLVEMSQDLIDDLNGLANNEKIIELKLHIAKLKAREEIRSYAQKIVNAFKLTVPAVLKAGNRILSRGRGFYSSIIKRLGLESKTSEGQIRLSNLVSDIPKRIEKLPYVYQRLFKIEPITDERLFDGRTVEMEFLKDQFVSWREGKYGVISIIGEKGSGRTTLLNFAHKNVFHGYTAHRIELSGMIHHSEDILIEKINQAFENSGWKNLHEFEEHILSQDQKRFIIVEDIQNMFLRRVGGFRILEEFLLLVSRTKNKIYWILTCTLYSWRYLDRVMQISKYMFGTIELGAFRPEEIEDIILKRHRISGYRLQFEASDEIKKSRKYKKLDTEDDRQNYLKTYFFVRLGALASGNISAAMVYWLSAIIKMESDTIFIDADIDFNYSFMHQIPQEELYTLAIFLQHETLCANEHSTLFHCDAQHSMLLFNRLLNMGILVQKETGYQVNPYVYRAVVETLKTKNILH